MKLCKILTLFAAIVSVALCGCSKSSDTKLITFNVAALKGVDTGLSHTTVVMPFSGTRLIMNTDTVLYSGDVESVYAAENAMPTGEKISGFYFVFGANGKRKLTNITASNIGSYIVMHFGGVPMGLRIIDTVVGDGRLFVCSEFDDSEKSIHEIVAEMNESIKKVNEIKSDM